MGSVNVAPLAFYLHSFFFIKAFYLLSEKTNFIEEGRAVAIVATFLYPWSKVCGRSILAFWSFSLKVFSPLVLLSSLTFNGFSLR